MRLSFWCHYGVFVCVFCMYVPISLEYSDQSTIIVVLCSCVSVYVRNRFA